ncbi:sugar phosphate isomerase/epimerase family protein [Flavihumibacter profundi]|uniref:sugar phosphate isomerase/epimerase family protein n=1 Tax=Flavihumibacter profundi TaxID=2716883 RepID=UPI001CC667CB|nr:sugar phosphate isomerase/epimerase family protein [Flavihumibacter profundi]MBZ5859347.1 sugar phosphate isomerase/epimerase [Flavihumibacter profundi]
MLSRRSLIKQSALLAAYAASGFPTSWATSNGKGKFHIGACDWSLGKSSDPAAFEVARKIGLDGIMVNMGSESDNLHLRQTNIQEQYIAASGETGIKISSIAIGELNNIPYKSDPRTEQWVWDSVDVARNLKAPVVLLAFFGNNDLRNDTAGKKEVISRLKKVAPHAEKNGIILGIESYLNADEHMEIIDRVGSKNIKVYYDFRNTADAGFDTVAEFKKLSKDIVCELHMKENGFLLGQGTLDWQAIGNAVYEKGYYGDGWMQIEWAMPDGAGTIESYQHNLRFLQNIFAKTV